MDDNSLEQYADWKNFNCTKGSIPVTWNLKNLNIEWVETVQTDEVPLNDIWPSFTTDQKYYLKKLHSQWGVPDPSTKHYMSFMPELKNGFENILDTFKNKNYTYNFLKITPGHMLVWHFDTYATFVRRNNISIDEAKKIKRTAIMLTHWDFGHSVQIGNDVLSHWKIGDTFTWDSYVWHGAANYGSSELIIIQVSYIND